uniref:Uncharacterized protein n=1 Tax=Spumella elongata TaxID=89044 RepID=A0A7S3MGY7_9STRA
MLRELHTSPVVSKQHCASLPIGAVMELFKNMHCRPSDHQALSPPAILNASPAMMSTTTSTPTMITGVMPPPPPWSDPVPPCTPCRARSCEAESWSSVMLPPWWKRLRSSEAEAESSDMAATRREKQAGS